jgi:hypothetical protein
VTTAELTTAGVLWSDGAVARVHLRQETVANPRQRPDEPWRGGGVIQAVPQPFDRRVYAVVELDHRAVRPQPFAYLFAGDYFPRPLEQHDEDLERLVWQAHPRPMLAQLAGVEVQFKHAEREIRPQTFLRYGHSIARKK